MRKIVTLLVVALAASVVVTNAYNPVSGTTRKFKMNSADVTSINNEYFRSAKMNISEDGFKCDVETDLIQEFATDVKLLVKISYAGVAVPAIDLEACTAFDEQFFVQDVISKGGPKEIFPHHCPVDPACYWIKEWDFPHYKIPPDTPPGPVTAEIEFYLPREERISMLDMMVKGEVVVTALDMPSGMPSVPSVPGIGK